LRPAPRCCSWTSPGSRSSTPEGAEAILDLRELGSAVVVSEQRPTLPRSAATAFSSSRTDYSRSTRPATRRWRGSIPRTCPGRPRSPANVGARERASSGSTT
jgi:hypothetical protein